MRRLICAALLLGGCVSIQAETSPQQKTASPGVEAPAERIPTDIRRLTIIVRDIDKSLALYRDVLDLKVNYDIMTTTSGVALPAGEPGAKARLVLLNGNDPWIGWIGLMQWVDPAIPADPYPTRMKPGGAVLVVNTDDAVKRCAMAKALPGVKMTSEARLQVYPGRNGGPDIRVMGCNVFDPDGILVEINQLLKS
jgi:catechol 2,3-dioxygenase-like lactoylglutathione lyase family enzyme